MVETYVHPFDFEGSLGIIYSEWRCRVLLGSRGTGVKAATPEEHAWALQRWLSRLEPHQKNVGTQIIFTEDAEALVIRLEAP